MKWKVTTRDSTTSRSNRKNKHEAILLVILATPLLLSVTDAQAQRGARTDWNTKGPWAATRQDATREPKTSFKIFDNVYYVGLQTVCAYLVTTNKNGLVLIDTTYAETADAVLNSIRTLGFNPSDIDGGKTYRALSPGGLGMQFGPSETPVFLKSVERLKQLGPW